MRTPTQIPEELVRLAAAQAGALSVRQVREFGISVRVQSRLMRQAGWRQPLPRALVVHAGPVTFETACWLGVLSAGLSSVLVGVAAAHRWGFAPEPHIITTAVPHGTPLKPCDRWQFVQRRVMRSTRGVLPTLNVEDVVLDLCEEQPHKSEHWITAAVGARATTVRRLRTALAERSRHRARADLRMLLDDVSEGVESPLEGLYLRTVERAHGLPKGDRQVRRGRYRTDVEYLGGRLIVELDGELGHTGSSQWDDWDRDVHLALDGCTTLRFGWRDVRTRPCEVARLVARALVALRWRDLPGTCKDCRAMPLLIA